MFVHRMSFLTQCTVSGWKTAAMNAQHYLTLLPEKVVLFFRERDDLSTDTLMQDGAPSHTGTPAKTFLLQTFGEIKIIIKGYRFPFPPWFLDLTLRDFWL